MRKRAGDWSRNEKTAAGVQNVWAYFVSVSCNHCSEPACVRVCPTGAHARHEELGGLVLIDRDVCGRSGACAVACPYEAPKLDRKAGKMRKCDMCVDRLARKELPGLRRRLPAARAGLRHRRGAQEAPRRRRHDRAARRRRLLKPNLLITKWHGPARARAHEKLARLPQ